MILPVEENGLGFDGVWADDFHHTGRVSITQENEGYLGDFSGSLAEMVETLRNGWFYRGQILEEQRQAGAARMAGTSRRRNSSIASAITTRRATAPSASG